RIRTDRQQLRATCVECLLRFTQNDRLHTPTTDPTQQRSVRFNDRLRSRLGGLWALVGDDRGKNKRFFPRTQVVTLIFYIQTVPGGKKFLPQRRGGATKTFRNAARCAVAPLREKSSSKTYPRTPASRNNFQTLADVIGISMCLTPRCQSASTTAFTI